MTKENIFYIDIEPANCFKLFADSFNRVQYFICLTENIETTHLPVNWIIKNDKGFDYTILEPSKSGKIRLVGDFKYLMQRFLVRDCIENFAICLDEMYLRLTLIKETRKIGSGQEFPDILNNSEKKLFNKFRHKGLSPEDGKVYLIENEYGIALSDYSKKIIRGLKDIRDCLAHNNGIVHERHGVAIKGKRREFHWITVDGYVHMEDSDTKLPMETNRTYEEGAKSLNWGLKKHSKIFNLREPLIFKPIETYEIATSLQYVAKEYLAQISQRYVPLEDTEHSLVL